MNNLIKKLFIAISILILLNTSLNAMGLTMKLGNVADTISNNITDMLIENKICSDKLKDCRAKELILFDGSSDILYVYVYSINNIEIANKIIQICIDEYKKINISKNREISIFLSISKLSHKKVSSRSIFYTGNNGFYVHLKLREVEK